jgi:hypothetical protein
VFNPPLRSHFSPRQDFCIKNKLSPHIYSALAKFKPKIALNIINLIVRTEHFQPTLFGKEYSISFKFCKNLSIPHAERSKSKKTGPPFADVEIFFIGSTNETKVFKGLFGVALISTLAFVSCGRFDRKMWMTFLASSHMV